uniref:Uncharacterized protein n=1 Tax=Setaria italica TaxID=4555 RepID=K3YB44_SETIT
MLGLLGNPVVLHMSYLGGAPTNHPRLQLQDAVVLLSLQCPSTGVVPTPAIWMPQSNADVSLSPCGACTSGSNINKLRGVVLVFCNASVLGEKLRYSDVL